MIYILWCGGAVVLVVLVLAVVVAMRPGAFRMERSRVIPAPAETLFGLINDFHRWTAWSPWEKLDPALKRTNEGAAAGPGAVYSWEGNKKVGRGRMTILESKPGESVTIRLEFLAPWKATNTTVFMLVPENGATRVIWRMDGTNGFMGKAFGMLMNMDALIGKDFEKGLANLEEAAKGR